jgi:O-antigen ligase
MSEHLRALVVILILSTAFFAFAIRPASDIIGRRNFTARRNLWIGLTLAAFLASNFWIYTFIAIVLLLFANLREANPPALFFFTLFVLPTATIPIPGMGIINYLFDLSNVRMLTLLVLLPAFINLMSKKDVLNFGRTRHDKVLAAYLLLTLVLAGRESNITGMARLAFYLFIDIFLPYYVISRSLINLQTLRDALLSLVLAIMVLAPIAVFEFSKHWLLYQSLLDVLNLQGGGLYSPRDNMIRALVTSSSPIVLGYLMVVGMGFYLFLQRSIEQKLIRRLGMGLLTAGLLVTMSRGPWVGAAVLLIVFIATGRNPAKRLTGLALAAVLALPLIAILPWGEKIINLLPFIGSTDQGSVDYRERLLTNSMIVIQRNPWFGSTNFSETPEMEAMRQGQHIIDVVNSYLSIALEKGLVGLGLFVGFFALVVIDVYRTMRSLPDRDSEEYLLGRALLATLIAILIIIFTVSSISFVPIVYWSVAGAGLAYVQMVRRQESRQVRGTIIP